MSLRITILFLTLCFSTLYSEDTGISAGAGIGLNFGNYSANFIEFEGIESCGLYESGNNTGFSPYINFDYRVSSDFYLSSIINLNFTTGELAKQDTAFVYNPNLDNRVNVETNNQLNLNYSSLEFSPQINYTIANNLFNGPLSIYAGPRIRLNLSSSFTQRERIINPNGSFFDVNGELRLERTAAEGEITSINKIISLGVIGLDKKLDIGNNLDINLRAEFERSFSSLLSDAELYHSSINFWIGINYNFQKTNIVNKVFPPADPPSPLPIMIDKPPTLELISEVDYDQSSITFIERPVSFIPLINSVFFKENSSEIPDNYTKASINNNAIENHYNLLKHVANVLNEKKSVSVRLMASVSENEDIDLLDKRNLSVKKYLINLGIKAERIKILDDRLVKTSEKTTEGREENRRVSIVFDNYYEKIEKDTLHKILKTNLNYSLSSNKNLEDFYPITIRSDRHSNVDVKSEYTKVNITDTLLNNINQYIIASEASNNFDGLSDRITLFDDAGASCNLNNINKKSSFLKKTDFQTVLVFNFVSDELNDQNIELLKEIIDYASENSTIEIIGNTDKIGTESFNLKLAENRANKTAEFIKNNTNKDLKIITTTNKNKYPEDTPQGRFLNRSVRVSVINN